MVNIEDFIARLNIIMNYYQLSAALLADKINVQRSSISHLLSGRNKPSLDFVLKILKAFPEVDLYWLLNGSGKFPKVSVKKDEYTPSSLFSKEEIMNPTESKLIEPLQNKEDLEIERIIIFFKNGSFKNYIA
ncbi:helix-turn-helix transcriptional regulator [uncultured Lutibacter sp.]|uniref:helix-turn-helix domain-containing protein n=1 Tax=uncultured Lutibacter sp. TaxID=437739 RepID=UPI00261D8DB3|nr:helix-turn-helix transcriptional regulator [uncultured Lutibacter sp.]